jgi:hypothetical protein
VLRVAGIFAEKMVGLSRFVLLALRPSRFLSKRRTAFVSAGSMPASAASRRT